MKASNPNLKNSAAKEDGPLKIKKAVTATKKTGIEKATDRPKKSGPKSANVRTKSADSVPIKKAGSKGAVSKSILTRKITFDKKITEQLKKIVASYTEYPELLNNIERDTTKSFIDELNIDSVDFVEIIVDVEQAFNITIEDDEIYELKSFEDLYLTIEGKVKKVKK